MNIHQHIISGIKEQLFLNDYLVLPNFGGFVLKTQASSFGVSGNTLMAPRKTVGFNIMLKQNDGILSNWLVEKLQCSKTEAQQHLNDFAQFCNSVLQSKRRLSLNGIGFFYLDFENNICFEPDHHTNFFTESFGLSAIQLNPIKEEEKIEKTIERQIKTEDRVLSSQSPEIVQKTNRINYKRTAYFASLFIMLGFFLMFVVNTLSVKGILHSSLFTVNSESKYSPVTYNNVDLLKQTNNTNGFVADNNGIAVFTLNKNKNIAVNVLNAKPTEASLSTSKYEIILGCFKKMKNAKKLIAKLKENNIHAIIKNKSYKGMHVVSVVGINDKVEAIDQLEQIQSNYPKAWMKVN